jgi:hypothetical protein
LSKRLNILFTGEKMKKNIVILVMAVLCLNSFCASIWIEGENATTSNVTRHNWYDSVKKDVLSGREWLSHFNAGKDAHADYEFDVMQGDTFTFWLRANPTKSKLSYQIDGGEWKEIDFNKARSRMNIAKDNKPDLRFISWVKVGKIKLEKGRHNIKFHFNSGAQNHGGIDCFTFVRIPFIPSGARKPSVQIAAAVEPGDWFPIIADDDEFSKESVIDMSKLIDAPAGKFGFLQRDNASVKFEKAGTPIKFWAVGAAPGKLKPAGMKNAAKWLRKHGVNLVRQHTVLGVTGLVDSNGEFDKSRMDTYDRWFAAMKKEGIYSTWSVIYPHHGQLLRKRDGYDPALFAEIAQSSRNNKKGNGAVMVGDFINLDRKLQDLIFKKYFLKLLNHKNPYTGMKYKDDPALVILEFQNESNLFFHTLNGLRKNQFPLFARKMRKGFFEFIKKKYETKEAVATAWNNKWDKDDNWDKGELGLLACYHWGADGPLYEFKGQKRRCGDFIEFYTGLQKIYYDRRQKEVRSAGFKGVTVATAWKSGSPAASMANLYCDDSADMIDRHNYFGGGDGRHVIVEGKVNNSTHLDQPGKGLLNLGFFQVKNKPFAVSEWSMMPPNPWKAEAAPLIAFYGLGLQGWDASYHFTCDIFRMGDGWHGLRKYVSQTPHYMGQFPALSFAIYNNHIKEGDVVALRDLSKEQIFAGEAVDVALSSGSWDEKKLAGKLSTPLEAFAVGRVLVDFKKGAGIKKDISTFWDKKKKTVKSNTGELLWNYGERFVEVRSPKTQALIGFAQNRIIKLPGVTLKTTTPFVSLIFTPLDNQELTKSKHILITAMARDKQTGTKYNADQSKLLTVGGPPLMMEPVQARIKLKGAKPKEINALDIYGVPTGKKVKISKKGSFKINGTYKTYYYEIKR